MDLYIKDIDSKYYDEIKILEKNNINTDIVIEVYNDGLLTSERLQFIVKKKNSKITTILIKI